MWICFLKDVILQSQRVVVIYVTVIEEAISVSVGVTGIGGMKEKGGK